MKKRRERLKITLGKEDREVNKFEREKHLGEGVTVMKW